MVNASRLLDAVIERGSKSDVEAWARSGREGLLALRSELTSTQGSGRWQGVHPRDVIDMLSEATAVIATHHPDLFMEVFADSKFDENGFVLIGLGVITDQRATNRLLAAARSENSWTRVDATIGLGGRNDPAAVDALLRLLDDPEYLVRYHALRGLAATRDARSTETLRSWQPRTEIEREMAEYAIAASSGATLPTGPRIEAAMRGVSRDIPPR